MKATARLWVGGLLCVLLLIVVGAVLLRSNDKRSTKLHGPELEYLKRVNSIAPPKDPELMFILMGEFASSNLQDEGAEFFSARLRDFEPQLTPVQKSLYLGIIGLLRAQNASRVPLLRRYGYVKDTIATLDQAKQLQAVRFSSSTGSPVSCIRSFPASFTSARLPRRNSVGVWGTQTKHLIQHGCAKFTFIWLNSR